MKQLFFGFLLAVTTVSFAQQDPILKKMGAYRNNFTLRDSSLVTSLNRMAGDSSFLNPERSQVFSRKALNIARTIEFEDGECSSLLVIATAKVYSNQFDSALYYARQSERLANRIKNPKWQVKSLEMLGNINSYKEDYKEAIKYLLAAEKVADQNKKDLLPAIYCNVGYVFDKTDNVVKAKEYCNKAITSGLQYKDTGALMTAYNILGLLNKVDSTQQALAYFQKGLDLAEKKGHAKRESELLYNMSNIFFNQGDVDKGFEYFNRSIEVSKNKGSYLSIAQNYHAMSMNYERIDKHNLAEQYADSAMRYAMLCGNFEVIMESYAQKAELYANQGDYRRGMENLLMAYNYKDSLNLAAINGVVSDSEAKYETEKRELKFKLEKERDQKVADEKIRSREILLWLSGFALILFIVLAILLRKQNGKIRAKNLLVETQKNEIESQHNEISESIRYAERIQQSLLPAPKSWGVFAEKLTLLYQPKDVVSGDFYWVHIDPESGKYFFAVADCTGHGVPGSLVSMLAISSLNEVIRTAAELSSGEILNLLRERIVEGLAKGDHASNDGLDLSFCIYDPKTKMLQYSGANNDLWIIRRKEPHLIEMDGLQTKQFDLLEIAGDRMPIGNYFKVPPPFATHTMELRDEDQLVLYTDGFADQFGGDQNKKYKYGKLKRFLLENREHTQSRITKAALSHEFNAWKGSSEQTDDVCIVVIEI